MIKNEGISVRYSGLSGRGVFAERDFNPGELIEACPILPIDHDAKCETWNEDEPIYQFYTYHGTDHYQVLALGYGSLYNHSDNPSADHEFHQASHLIIIRALRFIAAGEEITISYYDPNKYELTFIDGMYDAKPKKQQNRSKNNGKKRRKAK